MTYDYSWQIENFTVPYILWKSYTILIWIIYAVWKWNMIFTEGKGHNIIVLEMSPTLLSEVRDHIFLSLPLVFLF